MAKFMTEEGRVVSAVSAEQMRQIDRIATELTGPSLLQMMEHAGRNLALTAMEVLPQTWRQATYLILAGGGGNGGGAICAARHLRNRGLNVLVYLGHKRSLSAAAEHQLKIFKAAKGQIVDRQALEHLHADVIMDGLIGYSLRGAPEGETAMVIDWANQQQAFKLALDIPSGVDATSGLAPGRFFKADLTLTLALPKHGLHNASCGQLILADIGIPAQCFKLAKVPFEPEIWGQGFRINILRQS